MSGAADNIKKWEAKEGRFLRNFSGHNAIINSLAVNQDGVMVSSADNGSMRFWDYTTGHCFQSETTKAQPGSLDSEAGIYASTFDKTGLYVSDAEVDAVSLFFFTMSSRVHFFVCLLEIPGA